MACLLFIYQISPLCGVAETPDCGMLVIHLLYKALYVASLRRPTMACLLFIYAISPLCGVAQTPDCGMFVIYLLYKPFMWCRLDARLRHALYHYPFEASLQTPDRCILFLLCNCPFMLHINNLLACIRDFYFFD